MNTKHLDRPARRRCKRAQRKFWRWSDSLRTAPLSASVVAMAGYGNQEGSSK